MSRALKKISILLIIAAFVLYMDDKLGAAVYKWKDKKGKLHFTDDLHRVPEEFRRNKMKLRPLPKIKIDNDKRTPKPPKDVDENIASEELQETDKKLNSLTESDKSAIEAVVAYFKEDMPRYAAVYGRHLSNGNAMKTKWKVLRNTVIDTIPQKEALLEKISKTSFPLLKEIAAFLKQVIAEDEKLKKVLALISDNTRPQINKLSKRLKAQAEKEKEFIKRMEEALKIHEKSEKEAHKHENKIKKHFPDRLKKGESLSKDLSHFFYVV